MILLKYDIQKTLDNAIKTNNKALISDIILDETSKLIVNKKDYVIKALNQSKIFVDYNLKDQSVLNTVKQNIYNEQLRKNIIQLIFAQNNIKPERSHANLHTYFSFDAESLEGSVKQHEEIRNTISKEALKNIIDWKKIAVYYTIISIGCWGIGLLAWKYLLSIETLIQPESVTPPAPVQPEVQPIQPVQPVMQPVQPVVNQIPTA